MGGGTHSVYVEVRGQLRKLVLSNYMSPGGHTQVVSQASFCC